MVKVVLTDIKGKDLILNVPTSLSEISLYDYVIFTQRNNKLIEFINGGEYESNLNYYLYLISYTVSSLLSVDLSTLMLVDVTDILDNTKLLDIDKFNGHINNINDKNVNTLEYSLYTLYELCVQALTTFDFKFKTIADNEIVIKDKIYIIPHIINELYTGEKIFSYFSTAQAVEIMQIYKQLDLLVKNNNDDTNKLIDINYSAIIKILAITLWEKDVEIPLEEFEFNKQVNDKMLIFSERGIFNALDALQISFFLTITIKL